MPPKTIATPDEVETELASREDDLRRPVTYRKVKNPGINKSIELSTDKPTIEQAYG